MSAACAGKFWLWGWLGGLFQGIFRRRRREKRISEMVMLKGSVKARVADAFGIAGTVMRGIEKHMALKGKNFTLITLDLLDLLGG